MTRLEELTLKLADDSLADAESRELEALLDVEPEAVITHTRLLSIEAALRGQRKTLDLAGPTLTRLRLALSLSIERGVMQRLEVEPPPTWMHPKLIPPPAAAPPACISPREGVSDDQGSRSHGEAGRGLLSRLNSASSPRWLRVLRNHAAVLAFAASVVLLLGLGFWFFSPTMGEPVLADVNGVDTSIERGIESIPVATGIRLRPMDTLHTGTNATATITFGPEKTRLALRPGSELKLVSLARGKRFELRQGRLDATVARQRTFQPMVLLTSQAEVRVLGTKFTLAAITNATRLEVTEGDVKLMRKSDGVAVHVGAGTYAVVAPDYDLGALPLTGTILREYWTNLPGTYFVSLLTSHSDFPDRPNGREYLVKFEAPNDWGEDFGDRFRGYVLPPKTGDYTFWIAASDGGELWLSPDSDAAKKVQVAFAEKSAPHEWAKSRSQQSATLTLTAGRYYYIEVLRKCGVGKDHLAIAWQPPGEARGVIPGEFLSPFKSQSKEKMR